LATFFYEFFRENLLIIAKICVYLRENTREILANILNIMNISPAIKKTEVTKNGKVNIKIRVSHKVASRFIATEFYVEPSHFKESGTVSSIHSNSSFINLELKQILLAYERKLIRMSLQTSTFILLFDDSIVF